VRPRRARGRDVNSPETAHAGIAGSALIDEAPAAIVATAPDGTLTAWNRRAEQLFGYTAEEAIGRTPEELGAGPAEAALGSRARGGDVWEGELAVVRRDGTHLRIHVVSTRVTDADGNPAGSVSIALEAGPGDRAQPAQMRLELLLQASELLARSLDADAGLQGVARLTASWLADVCAFDLLDHDEGMRRVAVADADRARAPLTERLRAFPPDPDALHMTAALREGRTEILNDLSDDVLRDRLQGPRHIEVVRQIDARSAVILPLAARGRTLGAMLLLSCGDRPPLSADDVAVAEELARRTAVAVDNSVLLRAAQEQADAAQRLQRLSDAALSHVDLDDLLEEILALLRKELESDAAAVLLMEAAADHLTGHLRDLLCAGLDKIRLRNRATTALRLPRPTLRAQLALLYAALFGVSLVAVAALAVVFKQFLVDPPPGCDADPGAASQGGPCPDLSFQGLTDHDPKQYLAGLVTVTVLTAIALGGGWLIAGQSSAGSR